MITGIQRHGSICKWRIGIGVDANLATDGLQFALFWPELPVGRAESGTAGSYSSEALSVGWRYGSLSIRQLHEGGLTGESSVNIAMDILSWNGSLSSRLLQPVLHTQKAYMTSMVGSRPQHHITSSVSSCLGLVRLIRRRLKELKNINRDISQRNLSSAGGNNRGPQRAHVKCKKP